MILQIDDTGVVTPNPGGQEQFACDWETPLIFLEAGWGTGKTFIGVRKLISLHIYNAFDDEGQPTYVPHVIVGQTYGTLRDIIVPALEDCFDQLGFNVEYKRSDMEYHIKDLGTKRMPSKILMRSADKPETITGWEVGGAMGDEAARWKEDRDNPKLDPYTQLLGRIRHPKANLHQAFFTYTNEGDGTKIFKEARKTEGQKRRIIKASTSENPHVAHFYEQMKNELTPELQLQYLEGGSISMRGGMVYTGFNPSMQCKEGIKLETSRPLQLSLDFNIAPGMHGVVGQHFPEQDLFTAVHEIHDARLDLQSLMKRFKRWADLHYPGFPFPVLEVYGDATGSSQWAGTGASCYSIIRQYLQEWDIQYEIKVPRQNPPVVDRENAFNLALSDVRGETHYQFDPVACPRLLDDFENLKRGKDGNVDKADRNRSHASDAEGYRIFYLRPMRPYKVVKRQFSV